MTFMVNLELSIGVNMYDDRYEYIKESARAYYSAGSDIDGCPFNGTAATIWRREFELCETEEKGK